MGKVARYKYKSLHVVIRVIREGVIQIHIVFSAGSCWYFLQKVDSQIHCQV